jgi:hypothetical protein
MVGRLMYLLDTNILLELLLDQDRSDEIQRFLHDTPSEQLYLSEFSLYTLGIVLVRRKAHAAFRQMVKALVVDGGIHIIRLGADDMQEVARSAEAHALDFDDAYQYVVARKYGLILISFDRDFDSTDLRRREPIDILPSSQEHAP